MWSISEIFDEHGELVFNLALNYVQNVQDAEEITQDVFLAAHQSLHTFRREAELKTWLYRISINKSLDFIKAKKRQKRFGLMQSLFHEKGEENSALFSNFNHPGVQIEQEESLQRIYDAINELPEEQKTALILTKLEHKSQKETAEIMELSIKAIESLLVRAKTKLKNKLDKHEGN